VRSHWRWVRKHAESVDESIISYVLINAQWCHYILCDGPPHNSTFNRRIGAYCETQKYGETQRKTAKDGEIDDDCAVLCKLVPIVIVSRTPPPVAVKPFPSI